MFSFHIIKLIKLHEDVLGGEDSVYGCIALLHVDSLSGEDGVYERLVGLLHVDVLCGKDCVYERLVGLLHVDVLGGEDSVYERLVETMEGTPKINFIDVLCLSTARVQMIY